MSVDTRAHIVNNKLREQAVLRRTLLWCHGGRDDRYTSRKALTIQGHSGDEIRFTLEDLGDALRVLKVSASDLGYSARQGARRV